MKVQPTKVIILSVGDAQYPQDALGKVIESVREGVATLPSAEVVGAYTIMDDKDADIVASEVSEKIFDAIIVNYVSWHITPYVMRTLKNYKEKPILVWGIGGWTDASGKLIAPAAAAGTTALVPVLKELEAQEKKYVKKSGCCEFHSEQDNGEACQGLHSWQSRQVLQWVRQELKERHRD